MKKILFLSAAFAAFTLAATAQTEKRWDRSDSAHHPMNGKFKDGRPGGNDDQAIKDLNLTKKQQKQWKKVHDDNKAKLDALKANTALSESDKRAQMKAIMDDQKTQTESILTADQKAKWDAAQKNRPQGGQRPQGGRRQRPAETTTTNQ